MTGRFAPRRSCREWLDGTAREVQAPDCAAAAASEGTPSRVGGEAKNDTARSADNMLVVENDAGLLACPNSP